MVQKSGPLPVIHSFPTRRSSDLLYPDPDRFDPERFLGVRADPYAWLPFGGGDRKSTRLNSSHTVISYAVFCLKKKNYFLDLLNADWQKGREDGAEKWTSRPQTDH